MKYIFKKYRNFIVTSKKNFLNFRVKRWSEQKSFAMAIINILVIYDCEIFLKICQKSGKIAESREVCDSSSVNIFVFQLK